MSSHCEEYIKYILRDKLEEFLKWFDRDISQEERDDLITTFLIFLENRNRVTKEGPL